MTSTTIWQNEAHANYNHEQDATYLVRTPGTDPKHRPREEWRIVASKDTPEEAIAEAAAYTLRFPGEPVRVERHTLKPASDKNLVVTGVDGPYGCVGIVERSIADRWQGMTYAERLAWEAENLPPKVRS